jgi:hypothetical protein
VVPPMAMITVPSLSIDLDADSNNRLVGRISDTLAAR